MSIEFSDGDQAGRRKLDVGRRILGMVAGGCLRSRTPSAAFPEDDGMIADRKFMREITSLAAACLLTMFAWQVEAATVVPMTDAAVRAGFSPYNWVTTADAASTTVCGAFVRVGFKGTRNVAVEVDTSRIDLPEASRFPILAWTINGGPEQSHQLVAGETSVTLCTDAADPVVDLFVKGMCPWINRYEGDPPSNAVTITGFRIDEGGRGRWPSPSRRPGQVRIRNGRPSSPHRRRSPDDLRAADARNREDRG